MMSNDALRSIASPALPRKANSAEHIWAMQKNGNQVDAELYGNGEWGWECQFLCNGQLACGRRRILREQALAEADERRRELERAGWITVQPGNPGELRRAD
jgi:hypothetical protein